MLCCKKCSSPHYSKSGHIWGLQRYLCKDCGGQFTQTKPRGVHPALRKLAVVLYAHFGLSMGGIGKLFKVSTQAVLTWIRAAAEEIKDKKLPTAEVIQVDEMWHFVNRRPA